MLLRRHSFNDLFREMNRLNDEMGRFFGRRSAFAFGSSVPPINVWDDEHTVYAEADIPGIDLEKLDISITEGNQLTIQGERPALEIENAAWHRQERMAGNFTRVVSLPTLVNADEVEATYENGVLRLTMPKAEAAKPRKIAVKSA